MKTLFFLLLCSNLCLSQVGIGTLTPDASSMLEVKSSNRGFLAPRMTYDKIKSISSPAQGLMIYCTTCDPKGYVFYQNTKWVTANGIEAKAAIVYNYILSTGQSSSTGGGSSAFTKDQPYINYSLTGGPEGIAIPLIPLAETVQETISSALTNSLSQLDNDHRPEIVGLHGQAAMEYINIKKGTAPYIKGIKQFTDVKNSVESNRDILKPIALTVIHGETDWFNGKYATYESNLVEFINDYRTDTNSPSLCMFLNQMNSAETGEIAVAHLNNPNKIFLVGPLYQYIYNDGIHLTTTPYRHLGEIFAKVIDKIVFKGLKWNPLMPTNFRKQNNIVTIDFNIPVGPLKLDTTIVVERVNKGFQFVQTNGTSISITDVALINSNTQVQITLSKIPDGTNPRILYAYNAPSRVRGYRQKCGGAENAGNVGGNLRDSDNSISTSVYSTGLALYNWCVPFDMPITI